MAKLSIAIVTYQPDIRLLTLCLNSLRMASCHARDTGWLSAVDLNLIDNSTNAQIQDKLIELLHDIWNQPSDSAHVIASLNNVGYGMAHNLAITEADTDYHLVLNPDVVIDENAIDNALRFMDQHPDVALLTPSVVNEDGEREYLNKRYPDMLTLLARGFAPASLRRLFQKRIAYYEMRDHNPNDVDFNVPLASGCFMLFRTPVLIRLGGFSSKFFLYFEDYDLSIRTHAHGRISYVPSVKIQHFGGGAARKGLRHIFLFIRSSITFFNTHGWRLW